MSSLAQPMIAPKIRVMAPTVATASRAFGVAVKMTSERTIR